MSAARACGLILGLVLAAGSCATPGASGGKPPELQRERAAPADDDLLTLVPARAETVLSVDLARLRSSPWTQPVLASAAPGRASPRGFDELVDVDWLVMANLPGVAGESAPSLELMRGRFDQRRLEAAQKARWPGAVVDAYRGCWLVRRGDEALALVTGRTVAAGPLAAVRAAIDASYGRDAAVAVEPWFVAARGALADEGVDTSRRGAMDFAVRVTPEIRARLKAEIGSADELDGMAARLELGRGLAARAVGTTASRADAAALAQRWGNALRTLQRRRSLAALGLEPLLAAASIEPHGDRVVFDLVLSEEEREALAERFAAAAEALTPRPAPTPRDAP